MNTDAVKPGDVFESRARRGAMVRVTATYNSHVDVETLHANGRGTNERSIDWETLAKYYREVIEVPK